MVSQAKYKLSMGLRTETLQQDSLNICQKLSSISDWIGWCIAKAGNTKKNTKTQNTIKIITVVMLNGKQ